MLKQCHQDKKKLEDSPNLVLSTDFFFEIITHFKSISPKFDFTFPWGKHTSVKIISLFFFTLNHTNIDLKYFPMCIQAPYYTVPKQTLYLYNCSNIKNFNPLIITIYTNRSFFPHLTVKPKIDFPEWEWSICLSRPASVTGHR